jgi:hypothetical protein
MVHSLDSENTTEQQMKNYKMGYRFLWTPKHNAQNLLFINYVCLQLLHLVEVTN